MSDKGTEKDSSTEKYEVHEYVDFDGDKVVIVNAVSSDNNPEDVYIHNYCYHEGHLKAGISVTGAMPLSVLEDFVKKLRAERTKWREEEDAQEDHKA